jgi:DNA-binding transcriptional LysR family regulator
MKQDKRISLYDLEILAMAATYPSIRAVARAAGLKPTHVSKIVKRLEQRLDIALFRRSRMGVELSREGRLAMESVTRILSASRELFEKERRPPSVAPLTIGSLSYLSKTIIHRALPAALHRWPRQRFRFVDSSADMLLLSSFRGAFDLIVSDKKVAWSSTWTAAAVGSVRWGLFARRGHALQSGANEAAVLEQPFVIPTYWQQGRFIEGDDRCPVPWARRTRGHETTTADVAASIAAISDHLAFIPAMTGAVAGLREIEVAGWRPTLQPLFLSANSDTVKKPLFNLLRDALLEL